MLGCWCGVQVRVEVFEERLLTATVHRYTDAQPTGSQFSSSSQLPGLGRAGQGLSRIPRPRVAGAAAVWGLAGGPMHQKQAT